jgi:hypothetical protein
MAKVRWLHVQRGETMQERLPVTRYVSKYFPPVVNPQNIDYARYAEQLETVRTFMRSQGQWFEDGHNYDFRHATTRRIVLGRYQFYVQFADFLYEKHGVCSYLLDYMARFEDGLDSLLFYIESAERIDINLEGIRPWQLWQATVGLGKVAERLEEIKAPFTTAWEINQVFHKHLIDRTWFHTGRSMTRFQAFLGMGFAVPLNRILDDNKELLAQYEKENYGLAELEDGDV